MPDTPLPYDSATVALNAHNGTPVLAWVEDGQLKVSTLRANLMPRFPQVVDGGYTPVAGELAMAPGEGNSAGIIGFLGDDDGGRFVDILPFDDTSGLASVPGSKTYVLSSAHQLSVATNIGNERFAAWQASNGVHAWRVGSGPTLVSATGLRPSMASGVFNGYGAAFLGWYDTGFGFENYCDYTNAPGCGSFNGTWGNQGDGQNYLLTLAGDDVRAAAGYVDTNPSLPTLNVHLFYGSGASEVVLRGLPSGAYSAPAANMVGGVFAMGVIDPRGVRFASYNFVDGGLFTDAGLDIDAQEVSVLWLGPGELAYAIGQADGGPIHVGSICMP